MSRLLWAGALLLIVVSCKTTEKAAPWVSTYNYEGMDQLTVSAHIAVEQYLLEQYRGPVGPIPRMVRAARIRSVEVYPEFQTIEINFNDRFAEYPIRPVTIAVIDSVIRNHLPPVLQSYNLELRALGMELYELIPNFYRENPSDYDFSRFPHPSQNPELPVVRNLDKPWVASNGLEGRHIALWHSHGWYYNQRLSRWKWQRPRLFQTVEDMLPMMFTLQYIVPMLEAAGAEVWIPRERDTQHHMVIADNDRSPVNGYQETQTNARVTWKTGFGPGFGPFRIPMDDTVNPFASGSYRETLTDTAVSATVTWLPDIPESGFYAVYISYAASDSNTADARYRVHHAGGVTHFSVNQQLGGSTWVYLGTFLFHTGRNESAGSVVLENSSYEPDKRLTADAVRFGGGMGLAERGGRTSGRPRYLEAARYHLQFSGVPDTLVWRLNRNNDYTDDFQSRGEWVNYLRGYPYGPNKDRSQGLGIPVDASLAFHTDAGVTRNDTTIGTLAIYSIPDMEDSLYFPDGVSRMVNRDLTDMMQTQIVDDIRALYDTTWVRRQLRNSRYSEAMRPNVPSILLELLSHQNFRDMQYALDPRFRFDVSRSIYKSLVRFVATQNGFDAVIQPLPVTHMRAEYEGTGVRVSWRPQPDPIEPTADPDAYVLFTRLDNGGFDNGRIVNDTTVLIHDVEPGTIYSFKVRAVNAGGFGFPSEVVSVLLPDQTAVVPARPPVLIINGFTRVSAPATVREGQFHGFVPFLDTGVPDKFDIGYTGEQYNYNLFDNWIENDRPGHGASHSEFETRIIPGNTFDFAVVHGSAIREAGYGFVTASLAAVNDSLIDPSRYRLVNLILGQQRQIRNQTAFADSVHGTPFGIYPAGLRRFIDSIAVSGGGIFVSGAHVGTDLTQRPVPDTLVVQFAKRTLGYESTTNHASRTGEVYPVQPAFFHTEGAGTRSSVNDGRLPADQHTRNNTGTRDNAPTVPAIGPLTFNTVYHPSIYRVDAPDAIKPAQPGSATFLRYTENEFSAAVSYRNYHRAVILGFPFETIRSESERNQTMRAVLHFLDE